MYVYKVIDSLTFYYNIIFAQEINTIGSIQKLPMIFRMERLFALERNALFRQLHPKPLLITDFIQSRSQFPVNLMDSPNHIIYVFFIFSNVNHHSKCCLSCPSCLLIDCLTVQVVCCRQAPYLVVPLITRRVRTMRRSALSNGMMPST